jgi:hypothetical protein
MVEVMVLRQMGKNDVNLQTVRELIESRVPVLYEQQRTGEVVWLLFLAISLKVEIRARCLEGYFNDDVALVALQIADAKKKGLIKGTVDYSIWNKSLTSDGLQSGMWLYSYEATLKGLTKSNKDSHVTNHKYFKHLFDRDIEFYRSGGGISSIGATLKKRKKENDDIAKLLSDFEDDFSFDADEIDDDDTDEIDVY